jgi:adenylate cyclase
MIGGNTYIKLKGTCRIRKIDRVIIKGKTEPVRIFALLDYHTEETFPILMDVINNFSHGLTCYQKRQWDKAIEASSEAFFNNCNDQLSSMYIERCQHMKMKPPATAWNGAWVITAK